MKRLLVTSFGAIFLLSCKNYPYEEQLKKKSDTIRLQQERIKNLEKAKPNYSLTGGNFDNEKNSTNYTLKMYAFVRTTFTETLFTYDTRVSEPIKENNRMVSVTEIIEFDTWSEDVEFYFIDKAESSIREKYRFGGNKVSNLKSKCYSFRSYAEASKFRKAQENE